MASTISARTMSSDKVSDRRNSSAVVKTSKRSTGFYSSLREQTDEALAHCQTLLHTLNDVTACVNKVCKRYSSST